MVFTDELSKLVHPSCLAVATCGQTVFILGVTATTWTLMYLYSPSKSLRVRFPSLNNTYMRVECFIQRRVDELPYAIRRSNKLDWNRVVTSGAEAWLLRKPFLPLTIPGSVAFGVFCGSRYYNLKFGTPSTPVHNSSINSIDLGPDSNAIDSNNEDDDEIVFGWEHNTNPSPKH
mmetsp:Transcript_25096/g.40735  ORF Transcript_25096/g.40735 Transcript_25096/m.40735 type:complete len:174 (+) Transcript_25096:55-576(+)